MSQASDDPATGGYRPDDDMSDAPTVTNGEPVGASTATGGDRAGASTTAGGDRVGAVPLGGGGRIRAGLRRRRRLVIALVSVLGAVLALALCAGLVAALTALDRSDEDGHRADRRVEVNRETDCLELEKRLNRVTPPGATPDAPRRAAAIRDENAALRPYLTEVELRGPARHQDGNRLTWWRQLLDARTAYAEALDRRTAARTPAFFLAPRLPNGATVAERLVDGSPAACAGSIRRLAAPDL